MTEASTNPPHLMFVTDSLVKCGVYDGHIMWKSSSMIIWPLLVVGGKHCYHDHANLAELAMGELNSLDQILIVNNHVHSKWYEL